MSIRQQNAGFSALHILLIIAILGIVGGTGWWVYRAQKDTAATLDSAANQTYAARDKKATEITADTDEYKTPAGYRSYEDKANGFMFAYPEAYGELKPSADGTLQSSAPEEFAPGVLKAFVVRSQDADSSILSRKYGPLVKLQDGKWIVTEPAASELYTAKVGDAYDEYGRKGVQFQVNAGLTLYTFHNGDEGTVGNTPAFVSKAKLHTITLPDFSDGMYRPAPGTVARDKAPYDLLVRNVTDSIRPIK